MRSALGSPWLTATLLTCRAPAPTSLSLGSLRDFFSGGGATTTTGPLIVEDRAPAWSALELKLREASSAEERAFRDELASGRADRACALATKRLFDLPEGEEPRLTLYRDTAAWCPYCEKVWLALEEKRVPYIIEKVNMNCYGDKPAWFWAMQPSGGIPVAKLDGRVITESNEILMAIERGFPDSRPLLPADDARVQPLLRLERELFSSWFRWLTSSVNDGAQRVGFETLLTKVEEALEESGGPHFLGDEVSLVDCMFAPFLERMAASLPYYKGLPIRRNQNWPRVEQWFLAMESRPSYRHIQSDFYTHVHDLPPQVGQCQFAEGAEEYRAAIDGDDGSWSLPLLVDDGSLLEPLSGLGQDEDVARREAAERLMANHEAVARFASRGLCGSGFPPVAAPLSDPNAPVGEKALPMVDTALRHVAHALLDGPTTASESLSTGVDPRAAAACLGYLRDRISVPRDMGFPAARQLRAHLNWGIEAFGAAAATAEE